MKVLNFRAATKRLSKVIRIFECKQGKRFRINLSVLPQKGHAKNWKPGTLLAAYPARKTKPCVTIKATTQW